MKQRRQIRRYILGAISLSMNTLLVASTSFAQSVVLPQGTAWNSGMHVAWTAGDVVSTSEINENFDRLYTQTQSVSTVNPSAVTSLGGGVKIESGKAPLSCFGTDWCNIIVTFPTAFISDPVCTALPFSTQQDGGAFLRTMGNTFGSNMSPSTTGFKWAAQQDGNGNGFIGFLNWMCVGT